MLRSGANEPGEQWMWGKRFTLELWMELAADEVRVVLQLDHFHQVQLGIVPAEDEPRRFEPVAILIVDLVAVAVALFDDVLPVEPVRQRLRFERAAVCP